MARNTPSPNEAIADSSGEHQLLVRWAPFGGGFNFDSLVWQHRSGELWTQRLVITREQFEEGGRDRRWISTVHSFDPVRGTAIIRVAEGDSARGEDHVHYTYSWREWDLVQNREIRFIRT
jgi:hypothetical protein